MAGQSEERAISDENPYAAPSGDGGVVAESSRDIRERSGNAAILWAVLFWLNTPLCFMLSWGPASNGARLGILIVCVGFWYAGIQLVYRSPFIRSPMIVGAVLTGLAQFAVFLHVYVGMLAYVICDALGYVQSASTSSLYPSLTSGALMTILTGGSLLVISAVAGWLVVAFWRLLGDRPRKQSN